jgi:Family of unknown function (DUF6263)
MKIISIFLLLCLLIPAWSGCSKKSAAGPPEKQIIGTDAANQPIALNLAWLPSKRYEFRIDTVVGTDFTPSGSPTNQTVVSALSQVYSLTAKAPLDGVQELDMEITAQRFFYQMAEKDYLISDSRQSAAQDAADPISPFLRELLNQPFKCFVADGVLIRTEGVDDLTADVQSHPKFKSLVESVLNEKNLKLLFSTLSGTLPGNPVTTGDSWPVHLEMDPYNGNSLLQDGQNTFTNWDMYDNRQCVHLAYQGKFTPNPGASDDSAHTKIQGGTISREGWFDPQLGMLVHSTTVETLNGTITGMDQKLPAQLNVTSNFRLLSVADE